ncbi:hypothetical protein KSZ_25340 [Dictyobacter formicarum]|uniref:Uncharacterized protein n=1 Tax=Dictyobacter formicarum TaxID=2778368 RepID=A0ABQ3VGN5_9CHLR|nr:hypothetical protein KSZ_25340 [Dictyobacter formicarum]
MLGGPRQDTFIGLGWRLCSRLISLCTSCGHLNDSPYQTLKPYESGKAHKEEANNDHKPYNKGNGN